LHRENILIMMIRLLLIDNIWTWLLFFLSYSLLKKISILFKITVYFLIESSRWDWSFDIIDITTSSSNNVGLILFFQCYIFSYLLSLVKLHLSHFILEIIVLILIFLKSVIFFLKLITHSLILINNFCKSFYFRLRISYFQIILSWV